MSRGRGKIARENGICYQCYHRPAENGIGMCSSCQEVGKERHRRNRQKRIKERLCTRCGAPLEEGEYRTCVNCSHFSTKYLYGGIFLNAKN